MTNPVPNLGSAALYEGMHASVPLFNREVKIMSHSAADPKFGTGLVMICSYGDFTDVRLFRELQLDEIVAINEEGKMTHNCGEYAGLAIKEAREKIVQD